MELKRLTSDDRDVARALFALMAEVFEEDHEELGDHHLNGLLGRDDFWAVAALAGDDVVGGITAYTLPMTRSNTSEIFIYDLAVRRDQRRKGVGRLLIADLRARAAEAGVRELFVAADNADVHALDFYRAVGGDASPVTLFTFR